MKTEQLFPKPARRMKQPRKAILRQTIRIRDAEIYRLRGEIARIPRLVRVLFARIQALRLSRRGR